MDLVKCLLIEGKQLRFVRGEFLALDLYSFNSPYLPNRNLIYKNG